MTFSYPPDLTASLRFLDPFLKSRFFKNRNFLKSQKIAILKSAPVARFSKPSLRPIRTKWPKKVIFGQKSDQKVRILTIFDQSSNVKNQFFDHFLTNFFYFLSIFSSIFSIFVTKKWQFCPYFLTKKSKIALASLVALPKNDHFYPWKWAKSCRAQVFCASKKPFTITRF